MGPECRGWLSARMGQRAVSVAAPKGFSVASLAQNTREKFVCPTYPLPVTPHLRGDVEAATVSLHSLALRTRRVVEIARCVEVSCGVPSILGLGCEALAGVGALS